MAGEAAGLGEPEQGAIDQGAIEQGAIDLAHRIMDMARNGDTDQVSAYVDAGVPVELTDASGNTLLMLAAYHGHASLTRGLLERGADPNRLNDRGQSPVAGAIFKGEDDLVRVLREFGADLDAGTPSARATAAMFEREDLLDS